MNSLASETMPEDDPENSEQEEAGFDAGEITPGEEKETKWEVVTETAGLTTAEIIVGRLMAEGIPARAWQEGAGQAFGLTVGLLGTGYVLVPESHVEQAKAILEAPIEVDTPADEESEDEATSGTE